MVTTVTSFGRSGLSDWLIQRFSAVVMTTYTLFLIYFIVTTPDLNHVVWHELYSQLWMRVFSFLVLVSIAAHAWIGLWAVITDYMTTRLMGPKALVLRMLVLTAYGLITLTYLIWGFEILWGN